MARSAVDTARLVLEKSGDDAMNYCGMGEAAATTDFRLPFFTRIGRS
jgi:hypothetical protein